MATAERITLRGAERRQLRRIVRAHTSEQRYVLRARIVLLAAEARNNCEIADEVRCDRETVRKWRGRFASMRMDGLDDSPRAGRPPRFSSTQKHDVFSMVVGTPPIPYARWTVDLLASELVRQQIVPPIGRETISLWLRTADVKPHRVKYWLTSNDPDFKAKKDRIVDIYLNPPKDGVVISVDEKTSIQALERWRRQYPTAPGRVRRLDFEYKRHGVVNLMAAFFDQHPRLIPTFTPTHASWLNQVEIWFSLLSRQALRHVSFQNREELRERILQYIATYNATARSFKWTSKGQPLAGRQVKATRRRRTRRQLRRSSPQESPKATRHPAPKAHRPRGST